MALGPYLDTDSEAHPHIMAVGLAAAVRQRACWSPLVEWMSCSSPALLRHEQRLVIMICWRSVRDGAKELGSFLPVISRWKFASNSAYIVKAVRILLVMIL